MLAAMAKRHQTFAIALRDLLRKNVNTISQETFVIEMNREFGELAKEQCFATAVVATFFEPTRSLSLSVAGHPHPIYFRSAKQRWIHVDPEGREGSGYDNLPLGIHVDTTYPGRKIIAETGDLFLLYSDALNESLDDSKQPAGHSGDRGSVEPDARSAAGESDSLLAGSDHKTFR
jgi:sigma-B regulation protein RsbU (phosphoserine phosphatase)